MLLHLAAIYSLLFLQISAVSKTLLLLLILSSAYYAFRSILRLSSNSICKLACFSDQPWIVEFRNEETQAVVALPHSVTTRFFIFLYLQPLTEKTKVIPLLIGFDSVSREEHRQIRRALSLYH